MWSGGPLAVPRGGSPFLFQRRLALLSRGLDRCGAKLPALKDLIDAAAVEIRSVSDLRQREARRSCPLEGLASRRTRLLNLILSAIHLRLGFLDFTLDLLPCVLRHRQGAYSALPGRMPHLTGVIDPNGLGQRQRADPKAGRLDHHDAATGKVGLNSFEVGEKDLRLLLRPSLRSVAKEDDRRRPLLTSREKGAEVGIGRHDHPLLLLRTNKDLLVGGSLHPVVPDMRSIVAGALQPLGERGRKRVVNQEPHPEATSGNSRSRTASAA